ncbi:MAG: hypothetical protein ACR2MX_02820 [Cyclobacteriaceae bacterium]
MKFLKHDLISIGLLTFGLLLMLVGVMGAYTGTDPKDLLPHLLDNVTGAIIDEKVSLYQNAQAKMQSSVSLLESGSSSD